MKKSKKSKREDLVQARAPLSLSKNEAAEPVPVVHPQDPAPEVDSVLEVLGYGGLTDPDFESDDQAILRPSVTLEITAQLPVYSDAPSGTDANGLHCEQTGTAVNPGDATNKAWQTLKSKIRERISADVVTQGSIGSEAFFRGSDVHIPLVSTLVDFGSARRRREDIIRTALDPAFWPDEDEGEVDLVFEPGLPASSHETSEKTSRVLTGHEPHDANKNGPGFPFDTTAGIMTEQHLKVIEPAAKCEPLQAPVAEPAQSEPQDATVVTSAVEGPSEKKQLPALLSSFQPKTSLTLASTKNTTLPAVITDFADDENELFEDTVVSPILRMSPSPAEAPSFATGGGGATVRK